MSDHVDQLDSQFQQAKLGTVFWLCLALIGIAAVPVWLALSGIRVIDEPSHIPTVNDIQQLAMALETFKAKYGIYPPSRILLSNDGKQIDRESLAYLLAIWPRLNWSAEIDWSGGVKGFKSAKLEGDQCLVYFLNGPRGDGFSINPPNPTAPGGPRVGPFFEFDENRLIQRVKGNPFSSFQDGYRKNVYAYFCTVRTKNNYRADCPSLKVAPYFKKGSMPVKYYYPSSFQIISAGKDGIFGPGGAWAPESAAKDVGPNGLDDLCNFHGEFLGRK